MNSLYDGKYICSYVVSVYIQFPQNTVPVFVGSCIKVIAKIKWIAFYGDVAIHS